MSDRIDKRLKEVGKSAAQASIEAGMGKDFIRDLRRKNANPSAENLRRLAQVLGTTPNYLLSDHAGVSPATVKGLPLVGVVEAGQFRDITLADQDEEQQTVNVVSSGRYPHAKQYALRVSGDSMDELFPDGSFVICADFAETGVALKTGMVVHVERRIADTHLVETTLKEVEVKNSHCLLRPRSSNPRHKPIEISGDNDLTKTVVRGLVIGTYSEFSF